MGLVLVSASFLLTAYTYHLLFDSPSLPNFQTYELGLALSQLSMAVGVSVAGVGWILDKREIARVLGLSTRADQQTRRLVGHVLVLLGAMTLSAANLYLCVIEFAEYYSVRLNLPNWTFWFTYMVEGMGVLGIAVGWWIQRSASRADAPRTF